MFFENFKLALSSMKTSKMRTFLSLLGIIIGVGSVVAILNLGQSANETIIGSLEVGGIDMINVIPTGWSRSNSKFTEEFSQTFSQNVDGIKAVLPVVQSTANIRHEKEIVKSAPVLGVTSAYFDENNLTLEDGEFFTSEDNIQRRQVVVLGHDLAEDLFPSGGAVGSHVSLFRTQAKRYLVVGVLEEKDAVMNASYNNNAFIPFNTYDQRFRKTNQVSFYILKTATDYDASEVANSVEEYLTEITSSDDFELFSPAQLVEMANSIMSTFSSFLAAIAAISLVVGGIGIMNIMLVSVVERTKEIGIRKALGANPRVIRGQFLVEAVTLTLFGGFLGIGFGSLLSYVVVHYAGWNLHFSIKAIVIALGFSTFVGVFFGWYPAAKASKLDPIQALSYE